MHVQPRTERQIDTEGEKGRERVRENEADKVTVKEEDRVTVGVLVKSLIHIHNIVVVFSLLLLLLWLQLDIFLSPKEFL